MSKVDGEIERQRHAGGAGCARRRAVVQSWAVLLPALLAGPNGCRTEEAPRPAGTPADTTLADTALADTALADTASPDTAGAVDTPPEARIPEETELELVIALDPPLQGIAPVFAECRTIPSPEGVPRYEVATTPADFEGGAAALGVVIDGYDGPRAYTEKVTVVVSLGKDQSPFAVLVGREGCVAQVDGPQVGSFSCEGLRRRQGADTLGVGGRGSWRCGL